MNYIPFLEDLPLHYIIVAKEEGMCSWDRVICFHLNYVPACMMDWTSGTNVWPSNQTIQLMRQRGVDIVAKNVGELSNTWRISTSGWETILFNSLSVIHKRVYLAAKILFYGHLKDKECKWILDGEWKSLPSYLLKTLYFILLCKMENSFWEPCIDCILSSIKEVFMMLNESIVNKHSENFFIPNMPLISFESIPQNTLQVLASKCAQIAKNPMMFLEQTLNGFRAEVVVPLVVLTVFRSSELDEMQESVKSVLRKHFDEKHLTSSFSISPSNLMNMMFFAYAYCRYEDYMDLSKVDKLEK